MNANKQRDPFFCAQYWEDLCTGLRERAVDAHDECCSDKVDAAYYGSCIKGQLFDSLYHLLVARYSQGKDEEGLLSVFKDFLSGLEFCDDIFLKNNHLFFTDGNPNVLHKQLVVLSFCYVLLQDKNKWQHLAARFRSPHVLVDSILSFKVPDRAIADESHFKHSVVFRGLYDVIGAPEEKRSLLLHKYLKNWEKKVADKTFCGEKNRKIVIDDPSHKEYSPQYLSSPFVGTWAFEVVPLVLHFDIDDSEFAQYFFYPKALVAFGREG